MTAPHRREVLALLGTGAVAIYEIRTPWGAPARAQVQGQVQGQVHSGAGQHQRFIAEAERMRQQAVAAGDQSYGAVLVKGDAIVGWGPSQVVTKRNPNAHAERTAIWDAQFRLGMKDLSGTVLYSTSIPCAACQAEAAHWGVSHMIWGPEGTDAGSPRRS